MGERGRNYSSKEINEMKQRTCINCNKIYKPTGKRQRGCTRICYRKYYYRTFKERFMIKDKILVTQNKHNWYLRYKEKNKELLSYKRSMNSFLMRCKIKEKFTLQEWKELKEFVNYTCVCCLKKEPEIKLTIDHIIPLSKDGRNVISNIQPLCIKCNCIKHKKYINYLSSFTKTNPRLI